MILIYSYVAILLIILISVPHVCNSFISGTITRRPAFHVLSNGRQNVNVMCRCRSSEELANALKLEKDPVEIERLSTKLVNMHKGWLHTNVIRYSKHNILIFERFQNSDKYTEIYNEAVIGLLYAAQKFDSTKNIKFLTYATYWIRASIFNYYNTQKFIHIPYYHIKLKRKINKYCNDMRKDMPYNPDDIRQTISEMGKYHGIEYRETMINNYIQSQKINNMIYLDALSAYEESHILANHCDSCPFDFCS